MNASSLLNLTSWIQGLTELGTVKKHLLRASREVLLAVQSLLDFADQYVSGTLSPEDHQQTISNAIGFAQKMLKRITKELPRDDEEVYRTLHRKVVGSILEVLEREIKKNARVKNQKSKMKAEVYQAIKNVLLKEMYEQETENSTHDNS